MLLPAQIRHPLGDCPTSRIAWAVRETLRSVSWHQEQSPRPHSAISYQLMTGACTTCYGRPQKQDLRATEGFVMHAWAPRAACRRHEDNPHHRQFTPLDAADLGREPHLGRHPRLSKENPLSGGKGHSVFRGRADLTTVSRSLRRRRSTHPSRRARAARRPCASHPVTH